MNRHALFLLVLVCLFVLAGCSMLSPTPTLPTVIINSPVSGAQFTAGTDVSIQSKSNDTQGVTRVELLVDGQSVRTDAIPTGKGQPEFQVTQAWRATTPGTHIVIVRATNEKGATGEAALSLTVTESPAVKATLAPSATSVPAPAATKAPVPVNPAAPATANAPAPANPAAPATANPPAPKVPPPTVASSGSPYTLSLTEAQVNALINSSLAASEVTYIQSASVSLQNGQMGMNVSYSGPGGKAISGHVVVAVSASGCTVHVSVTQATVGQFTLAETQKAAINVAIEKAIKSQVAQTYNYTCIDSITIANGVMTIKCH